MKKLIRSSCVLFLTVAAAFAQDAGTKVYLALMQASNEVPSITDTSNALAIIYLHGMLDKNGKVISGSVDFDISTRFSGAVTITGLHIHNAAAGTNGPIVIPTDVNGTDKSIAVETAGRVRIQKQVQVPSGTLTPAVIDDLLANPQNYYVNIHTTDHPGGAMRAQLVPAEGHVVGAAMSTQNEVPPTNVKGSGIANVLVLRAQGPNNTVPVAAAIFNLDYAGFDPGTIFTGFHIHNGVAGANGPVIINTGLSGTNTVTVDSTGGGNLTYVVPISPLDSNFATEVATVNSLFTTPQNQYINIHSTTFPGGVMRDQLRPTEDIVFPVNMSPANEVPAITGLNASAPSNVHLFVVRGNDGNIAGGAVMYDMNFRGFPAPTTITGLHIHTGGPSVSGGIVIPSTVNANAGKIVSDTGNGNIFQIYNVTTDAGLQALNGIAANPNNYYVNIHTTVNAGGAIRDQLGPALGKPAIGGIASNASTIANAAPGSIISIYGNNLSPIASSLDGFGAISALATGMNGVTVTVGGVKAPFYYVGPNQINAQVPYEVAAGQQPVVVTNSAGSANGTITIASAAPSIFIIDQNGTGAVVRNADFSLVTPQNRAKAGDVLVIYMTGLGQTTPAVTTGALVQPPAGGFNNTAAVTVTLGGQNLTPLYSIASPGFVGLYQVAITVPSGLSGSVPLTVRSGSTASNTVNLALQ